MLVKVLNVECIVCMVSPRGLNPDQLASIELGDLL